LGGSDAVGKEILEKPYKEYTKLIVKNPGVLARTESAKLSQLSLPIQPRLGEGLLPLSRIFTEKNVELQSARS
jgi:hypothetical protein